MGGERVPALGELPAGTKIASYEIEELIGRGGMAMVYRAVDTRLGRPVALKILANELARDDSFRQRFVRESRAGAAVDHPNVIPVFEAGDADGVLFIAMRYVPGLDVRALIQQNGALPVRRAVSIITQIASALDAAHALGLVHRDVKPANMLLGTVGDGETLDHVYLSDFGLSKLALGGNSHLTGTGQFLGTIDYMAPEQVSGREIDGRTDQYALACAAFEMLAGTPPFRRDENLAVIWAQVSAAPPSARDSRPDLSPAVDEVLNKALAKTPADRYPTCMDFAAALRVACAAPPPQPAKPTEVALPDLAVLTADTAAAAAGTGRPATELAQAPAMPPVTALATQLVPTETPQEAKAGGPGGLGAIGLAPKGAPGPGGAGGAGAGNAIGGAATAGYSAPGPPPHTYQGGQGGGQQGGWGGPADPGAGGYGGSGYPGSGYPPAGYQAPVYAPRRRGKGPLILLTVVLVALAGAAVYFLHPGGLFKTAASSSSPPTAKTVTVTPTRSGTSSSPGASHSSSGSPSPGVTTTVTAPPSAPPADTVNAYYNAINIKDYTTAWNINVHVHASMTYSAFVTGYATTQSVTWTILGTSGNVVSIQFSALHTDSTVHPYHGTYTVSGGQIVDSYIVPG